MQGLTGNVTTNVIANLVTMALAASTIFIVNKFTTRFFSTQINLLHKYWAVLFAISVLFNVLFYLLFAYIFAVTYKWRGWIMGPGQIYGVIIAGTSSPLINFITFMFIAPKKWTEAVVVGVASLFFTYGYMAIVLTLYSFTFRAMEGLPGT